MMSKNRDAVLIVGGRGEFGQFLQQEILPILGIDNIMAVERDTPREEHDYLLQQARNIVLGTPLAGYAELACDLVYRCRRLQHPTTLWFIPSVQAGVWRAAKAKLEIIDNALLSAVFTHPMYGPNGFRATDPEADTFQNILTATHEGTRNPLAKEIEHFSKAFQDLFNISTTTAFDPEEHDRLTAYSQGLSYCVGSLMFQRLEFDRLLHQEISELHWSFHANRRLILDFLRLNAYMPHVTSTFNDAWLQTNQRTYTDLLQAFRRADMVLNGNDDSQIPTKWYQKLRSAAYRLV